MLEAAKQLTGKYWLAFEADDDGVASGIAVHANLVFYAHIRGRDYPASCGTIHHVGRIEMFRNGRAVAFIRVKDQDGSGPLATAGMTPLPGIFQGAQAALDAIAERYDPRLDGLLQQLEAA